MGREKLAAGRELPLQTERGWRLRQQKIQEKHPFPKAAGENIENWKQPQGLS